LAGSAITSKKKEILEEGRDKGLYGDIGKAIPESNKIDGEEIPAW